jgi:hypothetical protein
MAQAALTIWQDSYSWSALIFNRLTGQDENRVAAAIVSVAESAGSGSNSSPVKILTKD